MKAKRFVTFLVVVILIVTVLTSCSDSGSYTEGNATSSASEPKKGGVLKVAITGEPPTLDSQYSTAYLASYISWHIFEGLFTVDENYNPVPMLAKDYDFDDRNKTYTIHLREGVKFHNGKTLTSDDVIASLNRWGKLSNYGRLLYKNVKEVKKTNDYTIQIVLKKASPLVPIMLAYPNQQAAIYPKEVVEEAGLNEIKQFIGTGPFRFVEWKHDQYIKLERYHGYKPADGPANGMGGKKVAYLDEVVFIPTPEVSVRLDGVQTGQFDIAEQVSTDMYAQIKANNQIESVITKPYWWPMAVFNKKRFPFNDKKVRQAFVLALNMEPIMKAAFTSKEFYRLDPGILFQEQKQWWTDAGKEMYNQGNVEKAKKLLQESNYKGEKIRWLTSKEYDFMYKTALVAQSQLKKVGFNIELQVVDWATIVQKRSNPEEYEIFSGATTFTPDPGIWPCFDSNWPGFWINSKKDELVANMNTEMDPTKRKEVWNELQKFYWDELPMVKFGDFFSLNVKSKNVKGLKSSAFPFYWNVWKE